MTWRFSHVTFRINIYRTPIFYSESRLVSCACWHTMERFLYPIVPNAKAELAIPTTGSPRANSLRKFDDCIDADKVKRQVHWNRL